MSSPTTSTESDLLLGPVVLLVDVDGVMVLGFYERYHHKQHMGGDLGFVRSFEIRSSVAQICCQVSTWQ